MARQHGRTRATTGNTEQIPRIFDATIPAQVGIMISEGNGHPAGGDHCPSEKLMENDSGASDEYPNGGGLFLEPRLADVHWSS
jgi:hypothetical protein